MIHAFIFISISALGIWLVYQFARFIGEAQSGDINWDNYEPK